MDNPEICNKAEVKKLLVLSTLAGRIMLKSGAETYRVEDTVVRICKSRKGIVYADSFIVPTGIFISVEYEGELVTYIKRIKSSHINLNRIDMVNEFSRTFVNSDMSIDEGLERLKMINKTIIYNSIFKSFSGSIAAGSFSLLFGGTFLDFLGSFVVSFIVLRVLDRLNKAKLTFFIDNFVGAMLVSILSYLVLRMGLGNNLDKVIIGSIMPLVPGVAITASIRDTMSGDYISGLSRGMESVFSALAIALGVGIILNFYLKGVF